MPGAEGLDLDHAYKAMARLGEVDASGRSTAEVIDPEQTWSMLEPPDISFGIGCIRN